MNKKKIIISIVFWIIHLIAFTQSNIDSNEYNPIDRFNSNEYGSFREYIAKNAIFPQDAMDNTGVLLAGIVLEDNGEINNVFTLNSLTPSIDNYILDLFEITSGYWDPKPDSIISKNKDIIIVPIVYILNQTEYKLHVDNFKLKIQEEILVTMIAVARGTNSKMRVSSYNTPDFNINDAQVTKVSSNGNKTTKILLKAFEKRFAKKDYETSYQIILELLRREPLNIDYFTKLIRLETLLQNYDNACANLKFIESYFIEIPDHDKISNIGCK